MQFDRKELWHIVYTLKMAHLSDAKELEVALINFLLYQLEEEPKK